MKHLSLLVTSLFLIKWLSSCAVGPDYEPPESDVPDAWHRELAKGLASGEASIDAWWEVLNDPVLNSLVERAQAGNLELREAYARIREARAVRGIASGEHLPFIDAIGTYQRQRVSEEIVPVTSPLKRTDDFFQAGFDASWEIDIFGRIRRSVESADASFGASIEDYRDVLVALYAEVARTYIDIRTLQARLRFALANVETQTGTRELVQNRLDAELVPELDLRQAELNVASTESFVPAVRAGLARAIHRLGVLLGEHPATLHDELSADGSIPTVPETVAVGLPTDLLRQRPDVRRAERELAAQTARIGVATADLYPRFALLGTFTFEAFDAGKMWDHAARAYSFGPSIQWNIFEGGRIRNNIRVEDARTEQSLVRYERTVLLALEEVESSLVDYVEERQRRGALARAVTAADRSVELVKTLYTTGFSDFQNVLDAERTLFSRQDELAASEGLVVQNLVRLYKALGGGWNPDLESSVDSDGSNGSETNNDEADETPGEE